jgi:hypothetical protein
MRSTLDSLSDEELVNKFRKIAVKLGEIVVNWLPDGPQVTRNLFAIRNVLRNRGQGSREKLAPLLRDSNRFVRYYASKELIGLFPEQCRPIIEENTREFDAIAGDARGFLRSIDEGTYKPR